MTRLRWAFSHTRLSLVVERRMWSTIIIPLPNSAFIPITSSFHHRNSLSLLAFLFSDYRRLFFYSFIHFSGLSYFISTILSYLTIFASIFLIYL
ncbi:hypothetical protein CROQUDRAFT_481398 [Cronartium quercuum f. sp. fusiforme G11]|uniref:Uncharacterized protein n=1 Tax=Cronartium quercuum f. sp. fusiforme G11 TaxID=708437 RepID=A0A9P6TD32_9BASI|nr:hypothetical protein CROQUDRAFT_481398 [Cronartium quercuum f. sp. fusiforme G11]